MKEFLNGNKLWIKMLIISALIYYLIYGILLNAPAADAIKKFTGKLSIYIGAAQIDILIILQILLIILIAISISELIVKGLIKLIKR